MMTSHSSHIPFQLSHYKTPFGTERTSKGPYHDHETQFCDQYTIFTHLITSDDTEEMVLSYDAPCGRRGLNVLVTPHPNLGRTIPGGWTLLNGGGTTYKILQRCLVNQIGYFVSSCDRAESTKFTKQIQKIFTKSWFARMESSAKLLLCAKRKCQLC